MASTLEHPFHKHTLTRSDLTGRCSFQCGICSQEMRDAGAAYSCDDCEYSLHISCAELPLQLEHPFHPHLLNLVPETHACDNCGPLSGGFTFNCPECVFNLCMKCAIEPPALKHQLHEHALAYFKRIPDGDTVLCNSCGKVDSSDFYCCRQCNFSLHRSCVSLPPTIQHECHPLHPLVLLERLVNGVPEYQYCDYCEELRNPDHGVYRCKECWYTVHIGCVLPQVTKHENSYLHKLKKEMKDLKETIKVMKNELGAAEEKLERLKEEEQDEISKQEG